MSKNERWDALLNRQKLDRIPVYAFAHGFCGKHAGLSLAEVYGAPEKTFNAITEVSDKFGWQDLPIICYAATGAWEFGGEVKMPKSEFDQAPKVVRRPVQNIEDIGQIQVPDVRTAGIYPLAFELSKLQAADPNNLIMVQVTGPWSLACNICGMENIARWAIKDPGLVHSIQEKILPFSINVLKHWVQTFGSNRILPWIGGTATANNTLISPKVFETLVLPYMKKLYDAAHEMELKHIYIHICGEQNKNLPFWAELNYGNPGILSFGAEVSLETAGKMFPDDIIMGNIDTTTMLSEKPEKVYAETIKTIESGMKCNGGFMLAPGCEMPPMTPEENIWALMQAVSDVGWY